MSSTMVRPVPGAVLMALRNVPTLLLSSRRLPGEMVGQHITARPQEV